MSTNSDNHKVYLESSFTKARVTFDVTPVISESRKVNYSQQSPVHLPGTFFVYKGTDSRAFQLSQVKLVSRTSLEASDNKRKLQILRSWCLPYFNDTRGLFRKFSDSMEAADRLSPNDQFHKVLGAPPDVLYFSAYSPLSNVGAGSDKQVQIQNISRVPVIIDDLSITYPNDVDYIPSSEDNVPFPITMELTISLKETHAPTEFRKFNLQKYKDGILEGF